MAGQYEDAFWPARMQNWTLPRPPTKLPRSKPPTQFIANDRGNLLPGVPRSHVSPWGTFLGTWDMPVHIPPPWLDLSARSAPAASRIIESQPQILGEVCNGIRIRVTGKFQEPRRRQPPRKPGKGSGAPSEEKTSAKGTDSHDSPGGGPKNPP